MPGVVDLAAGPRSLPAEFIVDTNILVERLIATYPALYPQLARNAQRSEAVFRSLASGTRVGVATPTVFHEFVHVAVKTLYQFERFSNRAALLARFGRLPDWSELYKLDPGILRRSATDFHRLRRSLVSAGILIVSPRDLLPVGSNPGYDEALIDVVCRFGLDSNDAAILLEASNLGIPDIVTLDKDLLRAQADFTIYTWL